MYNSLILSIMNAVVSKACLNKNLLSNILSFYTPVDLSKLSLVNKTFHKLCLSHDKRWREDCFKNYLAENTNHR